MHRVLAALAAMAMLAAFTAPAEAAVISVVPASQEAAVGDTVSVDIVVSGLGAAETVGGFSFLLSFDDSILSEVSYSIGAGLGGAPDDFTFFGPGSPLDFLVAADPGLTEPALKALQGAAFTLARITFDAIGPGVSPLALSLAPTSAAFLSDFSGNGTIAASALNGRVCVGAPCPAPEPTISALMAFGAAAAGAFAARRRRRSATPLA